MKASSSSDIDRSSLSSGAIRGHQASASLPSNDPADSQEEWVELLEGKQWSRLLYTNPVCFLCTTSSSSGEVSSRANPMHAAAATAAAPTAVGSSLSKDSGVEGKARGKRDTATPQSTGNSILEKNVMVLSWLTATNNQGRFMFSINKRRCSAARLRNSSESSFCLCVPVRGMEELVLNVGSTTGAWGRSKFPADHHPPKHHHHDNGAEDERHSSSQPKTQMIHSSPNQQKKKKHKKHQPRFPDGIPGLVAIPVKQKKSDTRQNLFAIQGTVAHLTCRVYRWIEDTEREGNGDAVIDGDHFLGLAEVTGAQVKATYWNHQKNLFAPQSTRVPPYLTFLGSQEFGYVMVDHKKVTS